MQGAFLGLSLAIALLFYLVFVKILMICFCRANKMGKCRACFLSLLYFPLRVKRRFQWLPVSYWQLPRSWIVAVKVKPVFILPTYLTKATRMLDRVASSNIGICIVSSEFFLLRWFVPPVLFARLCCSTTVVT
jgi:hypothetical protein